MWPWSLMRPARDEPLFIAEFCERAYAHNVALGKHGSFAATHDLRRVRSTHRPEALRE
jgi:hypothetical protein